MDNGAESFDTIDRPTTAPQVWHRLIPSPPAPGLFDGAQNWSPKERVALFQQGAQAREVFSLEQGVIKLSLLLPTGREVITSLVTEPGSLIGACCAILGSHQISAAVATRGTRLRRLPAEQFRRLVQHDSKLSWSLHQKHCAHLADLLDRTAQFDYLDARQRLEQLLWRLASACELLATPKGLRMQLPLTNIELAGLLAVTPEHFCRLLAQIEREGLIRRDKGWLYLIDREALFHHARKPLDA